MSLVIQYCQFVPLASITNIANLRLNVQVDAVTSFLASESACNVDLTNRLPHTIHANDELLNPPLHSFSYNTQQHMIVLLSKIL